jgi:hypothetical protein
METPFPAGYQTLHHPGKRGGVRIVAAESRTVILDLNGGAPGMSQKCPSLIPRAMAAAVAASPSALLCYSMG